MAPSDWVLGRLRPEPAASRAIYNIFFKRSSTYMMTVMVTATTFGIGYDYFMNAIWDMNNRGVRGALQAAAPLFAPYPPTPYMASSSCASTLLPLMIIVRFAADVPLPTQRVCCRIALRALSLLPPLAFLIWYVLKCDCRHDCRSNGRTSPATMLRQNKYFISAADGAALRLVPPRRHFSIVTNYSGACRSARERSIASMRTWTPFMRRFQPFSERLLNYHS